MEPLTTRRPQITVDTNCVLDAYERGPTRVFTKEMDDLIRRARRGEIDLAVTSAFDRDWAGRTGEAERQDRHVWLRVQPIKRGLGGLFRLDASPLDGPDVLASEVDVEVVTALQRLLFPGLVAGVTKNWRGKIADVDHLAAHRRNGRDVFVTGDMNFLRKAVPLADDFAIRVMSPVHCLRWLDAS